MKRKNSGGASVKISSADLARMKQEGGAALEYYRTSGLAQARSQATGLVYAGAISLFGLIFLKWAPMTMLVFLVMDAVLSVLSDILRTSIAGRWVEASHKRDHDAGQILLIADGLEDGTGERPDNGQAPKPGLILFFGIVSTVALVPVLAAATEKTGIAPLRAVVDDKWFPWIVGLDAAWRLPCALFQAVMARRLSPGTKMIFLESGGVAVLYCGLLVLIWLPINWGERGLLMLFFVLYAFRLAFGIFAYLWTPRAVETLRRRVQQGDYTIREKSAKA